MTLWLFRYAKYGQLNITVSDIKRMLGYSPDNKSINYIIKENGILDNMNYTQTSTDYPIAWEYDGINLEFDMFKELDTETKNMMYEQHGRNYKIKLPIKGLWRNEESEEDGVLDGVFYDVQNSHLVTFDIFIECMENEELGCIGFYLYGFLKCMCQWHNDEYNSAIYKLSKETGIKSRTLEKYLSNLYTHKLIDYESGGVIKRNDKFKREANTYMVHV